jgi:DNA-binding transcriptional MerR regulator
MNRFTTEEICKKSGVTPATLKYLLRAKHFQPTWPSSGKRQRNYYSNSDLEALKRYANACHKHEALRNKK